MNTKTLAVFSTAVIMVMLATVMVATTQIAGAREDKPTAQTNTKKADSTSKPAAKQPAAKSPYTYVAQPGDSYSKMARKAIQTYGIRNKVDLTKGRIMYAETLMTQQAGSPELLQGQAVTIDEATVKSWVEKAKGLSKEQSAKWDKYTVGVNFDTRQVGESRR